MPGDECLYVWERMSKVKAGEWNQYPTNGFISNIQIPIACKTENPYRYKYKNEAIQYAASALSDLLEGIRQLGTFIPMPPSKTKDHPDHDDRLIQVLKTVKPPISDIRELVLLTQDCDSKQKGRTPEDRAKDYSINEDVADPEPTVIFVFDDVLTTGCHFKAVKMVLQERFSSVAVYGIFLARAVRSPDEGIS